MNHKRNYILAGCVLMCSFAPAQNQPRKEYAFSGVASETSCRRLPAPSFTIGPSGDRAATRDRLTVKCVWGTLSLSFMIDTTAPSAFNQKIYTFRWGESKNSRKDAFKGQFTQNEKLCTALVDLFYSTLPEELSSGSESGLEPMHWSATCNPDDQWGTSMEIEVSPHAEVRNPRQSSANERNKTERTGESPH